MVKSPKSGIIPKKTKKLAVWIAASTILSTSSVKPCTSFSPISSVIRRHHSSTRMRKTEMEALSFRRRNKVRHDDRSWFSSSSSATSRPRRRQQQQQQPGRKAGFRLALRSVFRNKSTLTKSSAKSMSSLDDKTFVTVEESSNNTSNYVDIESELDEYTAFLISHSKYYNTNPSLLSTSISFGDDDFIRNNFELSTPMHIGLPNIVGHEPKPNNQEQEQHQSRTPSQSPGTTTDSISDEEEDILKIPKSKNGFKLGPLSIGDNKHDVTTATTAAGTVTGSTPPLRSRKMWLFGWKGIEKYAKASLDLVHLNNSNNAVTGIAMPTKQRNRRGHRRQRSSDVLGTHRWLQNSLKERFHRWSKVDPVNLDIQATPRGSIVKNLCKGLYCTNIHMKFDQLIFNPIQVTGGGHIAAKRLAINLFGGPRFPKQFDFHATNCTFTERDLFESSCIRNGSANLLVRILKNINVGSSSATDASDPITVKVTQVKILPSNKIAILGEATTILDSRVSFEVRSGISTSSRGHIVTFPGLEVSLNPSLGVFMPVVPEIALDIGHNAQIKHINVNHEQKHVKLSARVSITPEHTVRLRNYHQSNDAYLANFHFDVGKWLTTIGRFAN